MDNQYYEMPKWSVFIVESYGNGSAIFECKRATVNLDDLDFRHSDGCILYECDAEENKQFGGGQWYGFFGYYWIVTGKQKQSGRGRVLN